MNIEWVGVGLELLLRLYIYIIFLILLSLVVGSFQARNLTDTQYTNSKSTRLREANKKVEKGYKDLWREEAQSNKLMDPTKVQR